MKKTLLLLCLSLFAGIKAFAWDAKIDGIYYNFSGDEAIVWKAVNHFYTGTYDIPYTIGVEGKTYTVTSIGNQAFLDCAMSSVIIPNSVTSIGDYVFYDCPNLTSVTISNSLTSISRGTFEYCSSLTSVTIPSSVTSIDFLAFAGCTNLSEVWFGGNLKSIGSSCFENCTSLTWILLPDSVETIGIDAFKGCDNLTSVTVNFETPIEITENTFSNRARATLEVPFCCKEAFEAAPYWKQFKNIKEQTTKKNVVINGIRYQLNSETNTAEVINYQDSPYTGSINIPASVQAYNRTFKVTGISSNAFIYNSDITSVSIPEGVTSIGLNAFQDCTGLTSVTIPSSLTTINNYAFFGCSNLETIICYADIPPTVGVDVFKNVDVSKVALYVPDEYIPLYKAHNIWKQFFLDTITGIQTMEEGRSKTEDGSIFNLAGQRLSKMQKGINIKDGKKIMIK